MREMPGAGQLAGRTLVGRYEVLDLVGSGGMGEVYRARDRELDDLIALKVIRHDLLAYPEVVDRFRKEVKLARRVTHPNVARAFDLVIAEGSTFYTMELVEGVPLSRRMTGPMPVGEAATIVVALCDALSAAHDAGIVHRDVKPANVLLGHDGRIVLTDFGIAAVHRQVLGELEGTPRFMAPEQARGEPATPAADLYALGIVLYEMLAGSPGFPGTLAEILDAKQRVDHLVLDTADARLGELVANATHREPQRRPHSAQAFKRAIAPFARSSARVRSSESSIRRAPPLPTVIARPPTATSAPHLVEGFHQAFVDRLVQWPRIRVVHEVVHAPGTVLVDIATRDDDAELVATSRPTSITVRFPLDAESLARSVEQAARLVAVLAGSDAAPPMIRGQPVPPGALELILQARHDARRDRAALASSVERCERALAIAPGNARVLAALSTCQAQLAFYDARTPEDLLDAANRNALAALAADPDCAEAHAARAHVELHAGRPVIAAICFRAAIARAPLMSEAHEWLGRMLLEAGFIVDAMARLDDAFAMGPLPALRWGIALAHALDGRWDDVDRETAALRDSRWLAVDGGRGYVLRLAAWRRDRDVVRAAHADLAKLGGTVTFERELVLAIYDPVRPWPERRGEILTMVQNRELGGARRRAFIAQLAAEAAGHAGDIETCLALLLRASSEGLFHLHWLDRCPLLEPVRGEPRYAVIRTDVAARAEAIHDALYSDHRDQATIATAAAFGSG